MRATMYIFWTSRTFVKSLRIYSVGLKLTPDLKLKKSYIVEFMFVGRWVIVRAAQLMYRPDCLAQTARNSTGSLLRRRQILIRSSGDFWPTFLMSSN